MECEERIRDRLPDYHLGHLPPDEAEEVRRHLAEHPACREALEEVAEVLDLMPLAVPPARPPAGLKERAIARALAGEQTARPTPGGEPRRERSLARRLLIPVAAALLVLAFVAVPYLSLERENDRLQAEVRQLREEVRGGEGGLAVVAVDGTGRAPEARGTAVIDAPEGALALDVYNLPAPPEGHSYQAWLLEPGGGAVALGEMETNGRGDGRMAGRAPAPLASYEAVQVTLEPEGSGERSGPVLMEASL